MKKAINMQASIQVGHSPAAGIGDALAKAFAAANPGMKLTVKSLSPPDSAGNVKARVYIEGEQAPPDNFAALASGALHKAVARLSGGGLTAASVSASAPLVLHSVQETGNDEENTGVVLPPQRKSPAPAPQQPTAPAPAPQQPTAPALGKSPPGAGTKAPKP